MVNATEMMHAFGKPSTGRKDLRNTLGSDTIADGKVFMPAVNDLFNYQPRRFKFTTAKSK